MSKDRSIPNSFYGHLFSASSMDLRIGQFMEIIRGECEKQGKDFFNVENEELCCIMEEWMMKSQFTT